MTTQYINQVVPKEEVLKYPEWKATLILDNGKVLMERKVIEHIKTETEEYILFQSKLNY